MTLQTSSYQAIQNDITIAIYRGIMEANPFYPTLSYEVMSDRLDEKYAWFGDLPGMREWLGERDWKQIRAADYTLRNKHWESSVAMERITVDDDTTGLLRGRFNQQGAEAAHHPDELLGEVINFGDSRACFDGQNFYSTTHQWGDSGVQSNLLTHTGGVVPTPEQFRDAFHKALIAMLGFKNDQGKPYIRPTITQADTFAQQLYVTVPLALLEVANKAFEQTIKLEGAIATAVAGTSNYYLAKPNVVCIQYLGAGYPGGNDARFQLHMRNTLSDGLQPFVFQNRMPLRVEVAGPDSIEYKHFKSMTEARYNMGYLGWWCSVQNEFTA